MYKLLLISLLFVSICTANWDDVTFDTAIILNPKPADMSHLKILPPSMQQEMVTTAKPMVGHSNRGTSKGNTNLAKKPRDAGANTSTLTRKREAEKANGAKGF